MQGEDPEIRTTQLKLFIALNKTRIAQMLAVVRWVNTPGVTRTFQSILGKEVISYLFKSLVAN